MPTISFHVSEEENRHIRALAVQQGVGVSALVGRLVNEGLRMRRFPGIVFRSGPVGQRAALAGSLDVWEVVAILEDFEDDEAAILDAYPYLSSTELRTVRAYQATYPEEIAG